MLTRLGHRQQRTLVRPVEVTGVGLVTGRNVRLRFRPAPINTGLVFVRTDLGPQACVAVQTSNVAGTQRRTTLGQAPVSVTLVEHALAALAGSHIDNCFLDIDAIEPPGLDGSALDFVQAIQRAGSINQNATRPICGVRESLVLRSADATLAIHPGDRNQLKISYILDYGPRSPIVRQIHTETVTPANFAQNLASCRTFLLEEEGIALRKQGIGAKTKISDLVVFGPRGPIENKLRFGNEPARHKILDIVGDLALLGVDLVGHVVAYRSGHEMNVELGRALQVQGCAPSLFKPPLAA